MNSAAPPDTPFSLLPSDEKLRVLEAYAKSPSNTGPIDIVAFHRKRLARENAARDAHGPHNPKTIKIWALCVAGVTDPRSAAVATGVSETQLANMLKEHAAIIEARLIEMEATGEIASYKAFKLMEAAFDSTQNTNEAADIASLTKLFEAVAKLRPK